MLNVLTEEVWEESVHYLKEMRQGSYLVEKVSWWLVLFLVVREVGRYFFVLSHLLR